MDLFRKCIYVQLKNMFVGMQQEKVRDIYKESLLTVCIRLHTNTERNGDYSKMYNRW